MISTKDLIDKFQYAIDNKWGYIYGQAGDMWTLAKQNAATRAQTVEYGRQWIGHYVADCSGLFSWAFKKLGGYMYHGSNTMYKSYCTANGAMKNGKRTDGQELKPGTAVFTGTETEHGHVGLYIGNGIVIEAESTKNGVIKSKVTKSKWTWWGELKGVDYGTAPASEPAGDSGFPDHSVWRPTIRRGSKGEDVRYVQTILYSLGYGLGSYGIDGDFGRATEAAVKEFQRDHGLNQDGVVGPLTYDALEKANRKPVTVSKSYSVLIPHLDKTQAEALRNNYPGSTITEE